MLRVILSGASGRMGCFVASAAARDGELEIVAGVDKINNGANFPIFKDFASVKAQADIIIDFSHPDMLDDMLAFALEKSCPVVIATTGYNAAQIEKIRSAAEKIPVFFTFNMSLGINLLAALAKKAAEVLGGAFDVEIIEKHHNGKLDAPSGTALMLADGINSVFGDNLNYEYDRHSKRQVRPKNEIGIHSVRGGSIVGEHEIIFAGHDEVITLSHSAQSREVFAVGAVRAAKFLYEKAPGLYDMSSVT